MKPRWRPIGWFFFFISCRNFLHGEGGGCGIISVGGRKEGGGGGGGVLGGGPQNKETGGVVGGGVFGISQMAPFCFICWWGWISSGGERVVEKGFFRWGRGPGGPKGGGGA